MTDLFKHYPEDHRENVSNAFFTDADYRKNDLLAKAYKEGIKAGHAFGEAEDDEDVSMNPHNSNSDEHRAWVQGHNDGWGDHMAMLES